MDCVDCFISYRHGGLSPWTCSACGRQWVVRDSKWVPVGDDERRLREALYALNRAIEPDGEGDAFDRLRRVRDKVFSLGVELYGWSD